MGEIITLQIGSFANFVGTHYWNLQDTFAEQHVNEGKGAVTRLFQEREFRGRSIMTPRAIILDVEGSLGSMSKQGYYAYETLTDTEQLESQASSQWGGAVSVSRFESAPKVSFQRALQDSLTVGASGHASSEKNAVQLLKTKRQLLNSKKSELNSRQGELQSGAKDDKEGGSFLFDLQRKISHLAREIEDLQFDIDRREYLIKISRGEQVSEEETDKFDFKLDENVKYWTDYNKSFWHPTNLSTINDVTLDEHFDMYSRASMFAPEESENLNENLRKLSENCSQIAGFQFLLDSDTAFGSIASQFLLDIKDEFGKSPVLAMPFLNTGGASVGQTYHDRQNIRTMNNALTLANLQKNCHLVVPISTENWNYSSLNGSQNGVRLPGTIGINSWPLLPALNPAKLFHVSSIIASAWDTSTLPFRMESGGLQLRGFLDGLAPSPRNNFSVLSAAFPLPIRTNTSVAHLFFGYDPNSDAYQQSTRGSSSSEVVSKNLPYADFMTPMISYPNIGNDEEVHLPFAENVVMRGVPDWACKQPADNDYGATTVLEQYLRKYNCPLRYYLAPEEAAPVPIAYPRYFATSMESNGVLTQKDKTGAKVKSVPTLTHLQTTTRLSGFFKHMADGSDVEIAQRFASMNYEREEVLDAQDRMFTLSEDYIR